MSQLREVLDRFATQRGPMSVNRMAKEMGITPSMLNEMIEYWVRKGKLREVNGGGQACVTCGVKGACPFVVNLPRYYEMVTAENTPDDSQPPCACGGHCKV